MNSRDKRISLLARGDTAFLGLPSPSGAITTADRGHLLGLYRSAFFISGGGGGGDAGLVTPIAVMLDTISPIAVMIEVDSPIAVLL